MSKKIVSIVPAPEDVSVLFAGGEYESPVCLALTGAGTIVPMVTYNGEVVQANEVDGYVGLFNDTDIDEVSAQEQEAAEDAT